MTPAVVVAVAMVATAVLPPLIVPVAAEEEATARMAALEMKVLAAEAAAMERMAKAEMAALSIVLTMIPRMAAAEVVAMEQADVLLTQDWFRKTVRTPTVARKES